jgi:hypothetical protein
MTALALTTLLALAPSQSGTFKLTNVRTTYGELGGTRPETKYLPGDAVYVAYDLEGFTLSPSGNVQYRMTLEVLDSNNKPLFRQDPADKVDFVPLGGSKLPARAYVNLGVDMVPGKYTMKLNVVDTASRQSQTLEKAFEVAKPEFGIVRVFTSIDVNGDIPVPTTGAVGGSAFVQFALVGFEYSKDEKQKDPKLGAQPEITVEMMTVDENGRATMGEPTVYKQNIDSASKLEAGSPMMVVRFLIPMTRPGKYTVKLKATDHVSKKTSTFDLPITVVPVQN